MLDRYCICLYDDLSYYSIVAFLPVLTYYSYRSSMLSLIQLCIAWRHFMCLPWILWHFSLYTNLVFAIRIFYFYNFTFSSLQYSTIRLPLFSSSILYTNSYVFIVSGIPSSPILDLNLSYLVLAVIFYRCYSKVSIFSHILIAFDN